MTQQPTPALPAGPVRVGTRQSYELPIEDAQGRPFLWLHTGDMATEELYAQHIAATWNAPAREAALVAALEAAREELNNHPRVCGCWFVASVKVERALTPTGPAGM